MSVDHISTHACGEVYRLEKGRIICWSTQNVADVWRSIRVSAENNKVLEHIGCCAQIP